MEKFTRALFDAAAWIAVARLHYLQFTAQQADAAAKGGYGLHEINPFWAGFPELSEKDYEEQADAR